MKILQLSLTILAGTISVLCASYHIGFATDEPTSILDSSMPPIILTQVELWGPSSFHTDGIMQCEDNETSLGPWAVGWVELHNTKNYSIPISDVDLKGNGWEEGQFPMTLGPQEYCYIVTQNQVDTRIGVGGSLGNGPPPHDNVTTILSYSIQSFGKKINYTDSTPLLSDDIGDTKTWQLVDSNWIFQDTNLKQELSTKITMLPPLEQYRSGFSTNDIVCKEGLYLAIKSDNLEPTCLKAGTISKLASRGFFYGINANETTNTTILIPPGSENPSSNKTYSPQIATVVIGVNNTVTWVNQAKAGNSIAPDMPLQQDGKSFGSDSLRPGDSYQFAFTEPGTFAYHGQPHPWQRGKIIVLPQSNNTGILAIKSNTLNSDVTSDHVAYVISIKGVTPITPGGPTIQITLKNNSTKPITSLNATLDLNNSYVFNFKNVTQLQPLTSGNSVSETKILIGGGFSSESAYSIIISGIADNAPFTILKMLRYLTRMKTINKIYFQIQILMVHNTRLVQTF